jgi:hypothetical protein
MGLPVLIGVFYPSKILVVFLSHFDKIRFTPLEIPVAVSPAKRGIERLETERGIISNGAFINFKILRKIPVRVNEKMISEMS